MNRYIRHRNNEAWLTSYADLITNLLIFFILIISASQIQSAKMERIAESLSKNKSKKSLSTAASEVKQKLAELNLEKDVGVDLNDNGLEISFNSGVMFDSGKARILKPMESPLGKVLKVVKPYDQNYRFAIEGHTDEVPIKTAKFASNWELSSARAMVIRQRLEHVGVDKDKIRVEAYADTKPLAIDSEAEAIVARAKQRRVVIRLF